MKTPVIRCSSIDRYLTCGHSLFLPQEVTETKYSTSGVSEHEKAERFLKETNTVKKKLIWNSLSSNTQSYCKYATKLSLRYDLKLEQHYECEFEFFTLSGHPDLWYHNTDFEYVEVVDLKSGYQPVSLLGNQFKGYAYLVNQHLKVDKIKITVIQDNQVNSINFQKKDIDHLISLLDESVKLKTLKASDECQFCPSKIHCVEMRPNYFTDDICEITKLVENKKYLKATLDDVEKKLLVERPEMFKIIPWGRGHRVKFIGGCENVNFK